MAATLELIFQDRSSVRLWSWNPHGQGHQIAHVVNPLPSSRRGISAASVALIGPENTPPSHKVVIKSARGRNVPVLTREAELYCHQLVPLQGSLVPRFHGFFNGKVGGYDYACMVLEYCEPCIGFTLLDQNGMIMAAVCDLHKAGVTHQQLADGHHILKTPHGIRFVDFSQATVHHHCPSASPMLTDGSAAKEMRKGCPELVSMEKIFGLMDLLHPEAVDF